MLKEITIRDQVLARTVAEGVLRVSGTRPLDRISVADIIRFRIEQEYCLEAESLFAEDADRGASRQARLNAPETDARGFVASQSDGTDAGHLDALVDRAFAAFRDTAFIMFVNDIQVEDLTDEFPLADLDHVAFVRLLALRGG